jgi:hypothetical protein
MRGEEKVTEPAGQIADDLYQVIVEDGESGEFDQPEKYGVPETYRVPFQAKMRIYREALVLFVLISKSKEDEKYKSVLRSYEGLIMPDSPTIEGMTKLEALNGAMRRLQDFLKDFRESSDPQYFSWSRSWFAGIGYDQINVIDLHLFSMHWIDTYIAVRKSVDLLIPSEGAEDREP